MNKEVMLIACPDQTGLIHQMAGVLFRHNLNITETQEFVEPHQKRFFTRIQFEGVPSTPSLIQELKHTLPAAAQLQVRILKPRKVVIFVSSEPHCLGDLLLRHSMGELQAEILAVISQSKDCEKLTGRFDLPFYLDDLQILIH